MVAGAPCAREPSHGSFADHAGGTPALPGTTQRHSPWSVRKASIFPKAAMQRTLLVLVGGNGSTAARFRRVWPRLEARFPAGGVERGGAGGRGKGSGSGPPAPFAGHPP